MKRLNEVYKLNKELDQIYIERYQEKNKDFEEKNLLSLIVEIGELANETRCFKYWSIKGPSPKNVILEEYADVLMMTLCFCDSLNANIDIKITKVKNSDIVIQFIELYKAVSILYTEYTKEHVEDILNRVLYLGKSLGYSDEDIIEACIKKININKERLNSDY